MRAMEQKKEVDIIKVTEQDEKKDLKARAFAWVPWCNKLSNECGGVQKKICKFYGQNGILPQPDSDEFDKGHNFFGYPEKRKTKESVDIITVTEQDEKKESVHGSHGVIKSSVNVVVC